MAGQSGILPRLILEAPTNQLRQRGESHWASTCHHDIDARDEASANRLQIGRSANSGEHYGRWRTARKALEVGGRSAQGSSEELVAMLQSWGARVTQAGGSRTRPCQREWC